ncbi:DNA repair protein RecO [Benzoatithermus flavus]|uniref:DNA repair protein RecO n=1 Tax=Benzoatithermus flavus TaxID=3108223 RepID=A0ABU8XUQ8_9PROT
MRTTLATTHRTAYLQPMEWHDDGIVLSARPHGETDAILSALTFEHGRHLGLVKGGIGRRARPLLQPGNRLELAWKARLPEHLGLYTLEPVQLCGNRLIDDPWRLAALASATTLLEQSLAEREPHPRLYAGLLKLLDAMLGDPRWLETYVRFELLLLQDLGFALDLERCAATGRAEDLAFVSPRTGRAVSREGAGDLAPRLLPLPPFLLQDVPAMFSDILAGLRLAGHFLAKHVFAPADRPLPAARERLVTLLQEQDQETPE